MKAAWTAAWALALAALTGCRPALPPVGWVGSVATRGDTTIVTSRAPLVRYPIVHDSAEVLWGQDSLSAAIGPVLLGSGELFVAERTRIYVLSHDGKFERAFGRAGAGPGEFAEIRSIGGAGDTLIVEDFGQRRITLFDPAGRILGARQPPRFVELTNVPDGRPTTVAGGLLLPLSSVLFLNAPRPTYGAVVLADWNGDSGRELVRVEGQRYRFFGGDVMPDAVFGPKPLFAISASGLIASTDGMDYCIGVRRVESAAPRRICRNWTPLPVTSAVRHPDLAGFARRQGLPAGWLATAPAWLAHSQMGPTRNSIDRMLWDQAGRLWVRVEDSLDADVHPMLGVAALEHPPTHSHWDLFSPDGKLLAEEYLPRTFIPYDGDAEWLYGIYSLESGEIAVARVDARVAGEAGAAGKAGTSVKERIP